MNQLNYNQVGGFPLTTRILDEIQKAYSIFNALGTIVGDKTIIAGCITTGSLVSDGVVNINGEVLEFRGGSTQTKVKIVEVVENLVFEDNTAKSVIKTRYVTFGTGVGAMDWVDFKRGFATKDMAAALLGKADQSTFDALADAFALVYTKMLTIEEGAEKNKLNTITYLAKGTAALGDCPGSDGLKTVTFASVGTSDYMVVGCMNSLSSNYDYDNDIMWLAREKTPTSFKITLREVAGVTQNLSFDYMLIPL